VAKLATSTSTIFAHEIIDEKSNEIPAAQALITAMGLNDRVFTLDAIHCQKTLREEHVRRRQSTRHFGARRGKATRR
jgi:predicted transposase YbfD/YdcC